MLAGQLLGASRSSSTRNSAEMAENNNQRDAGAARAPRRAVRPRRQRARREPPRRTASRSFASTPTTSIAPSGCWPQVLGFDERASARSSIAIGASRPTGRSSSCRTRRWRRLPRSRRAVSTSSCPTSWSSRCRRGSIRETMAAHLFGYVGEVNDAQVADDDELKSGDIVGQSGIEKVYNALLMGEDGAKRVVVNSVGREIRTLDEDPPIEGKRLQLTIDYDVQKAIEDGFRRRRASTAPRSCSTRTTATCSASRAGRPTTRTRSPPASIARPGRR